MIVLKLSWQEAKSLITSQNCLTESGFSYNKSAVCHNGEDLPLDLCYGKESSSITILVLVFSPSQLMLVNCLTLHLTSCLTSYLTDYLTSYFPLQSLISYILEYQMQGWTHLGSHLVPQKLRKGRGVLYLQRNTQWLRGVLSVQRVFLLLNLLKNRRYTSKHVFMN